MLAMDYATTILHAQSAPPEAVEQALAAIFANEGRACTLRLEGTFRAVLARVTDPGLDAAYRYLVCRLLLEKKKTVSGLAVVDLITHNAGDGQMLAGHTCDATTTN